MKAIGKICGTVIGILAATSLAGLIITGIKTGWGPFAFLHTWDKDVKKIEQAYPSEEHQNGIIFYGASNFRMWTEMEDDLADYRVQNHGFGGCTDKDLAYYADRLLYLYHPEIIFFQTGSNDYAFLQGSNEEKVAMCIAYKKEMFAEIHEHLPQAKIVVMSGLLLPGRSEYRKITEKINAELEELCAQTDYLWFVDAASMTWDGQNYKTELFVKDGIHLNHDGQLIWMQNYIRPMIEQLIEEYDLEEVRKGD